MALPIALSATGIFAGPGSRSGPFKSSAGAFYGVFTDSPRTLLSVWKSTDPETSWSLLSSATIFTSSNVSRFWVWQEGDVLHIVTQQGVPASSRLAYSSFSMATDSWLVDNQQVVLASGTQVEAACYISVRSDGDVIILYAGATDRIMGVDYKRVKYARLEGGTWTVDVAVDLGGSASWFPGALVRGASDVMYLFINHGSSNTVSYRTLSSSNSLSGITSSLESSSTASQPFGGAVYYDDGGTERIRPVYLSNGGDLVVGILDAGTFAVVDATGLATIKLSSDNPTTPLASIALDDSNGDIHILLVSNTVSDIFHTQASSPHSSWPGTEDNILTGTVTSISASVYDRSGKKLGYFYYDGSLNYNELSLGVSTQTVVAQLLANPKNIYNPITSPGAVNVVTQLLSNGPSIFSPKVLQQVVAQLIANTRSVNNPAVQPGPVSVVAQLLSNSRSVNNPTVVQQAAIVEALLVANGRTISQPEVVQKVTAQLISLVKSISNPQVRQQVAMNLLTSLAVPQQPSIRATNLIQMALISNAVSLSNPVIVPGAVSVVVNQLTDTPVIPNPSITSGGISVVAQLIDLTPVGFNPTVSPGMVNVVAQKIEQSLQQYNPVISPGAVSIQVQLLSDAILAYSPKVTQKIITQLLSQTIQVRDPSILPGGVQVVAQLIAAASQSYSPTISVSGLTIITQSISQPSTFYNPNVVPGSVEVLVEALSQDREVLDPDVTAGQFIVVSSLTDGVEVLAPSVLAGAVTVLSQLLQNPHAVISPSVGQKITTELLEQGITLYLPDITTGAMVGVDILENGSIALTPEIKPGGIFVSVEPLDELLQILDPDVRLSQLVEADGLTRAPILELPAVLAGMVTVQAESLDHDPIVYGPDIYFDQIVVVGVLDNPATVNAPRLFVGVVPTNWQWSTQNDFPAVRRGGFPGTSSDFQRTNDEFSTGQRDLKRSR